MEKFIKIEIIKTENGEEKINYISTNMALPEAIGLLEVYKQQLLAQIIKTVKKGHAK